jgi:hypothetical protein
VGLAIADLRSAPVQLALFDNLKHAVFNLYARMTLPLR